MSEESAHKSRWVIAEVVFGMPFLISIAIHYVAPTPLLPGILEQLHIPLGVVLLMTGLGVIVSARSELARYGQPADPGHPTSKIVKTGVYAYSRNPLYLGGASVFLGLALILNMLWALCSLLLSVILCHNMLIVPEERYLAARFGMEYEEYTASVHRWLGRK